MKKGDKPAAAKRTKGDRPPVIQNIVGDIDEVYDYLFLTGVGTPVGFPTRLLRYENRYAMRGGVPRNILVHWLWRGLGYDKLIEMKGQFPEYMRVPQRMVPHFGIGPDGTVIQFLDPFYSGAHVGKYAQNDGFDLEPTETIVIVNLHPYKKMPTQAMKDTLAELVATLTHIYRQPEVHTHEYWDRPADWTEPEEKTDARRGDDAGGEAAAVV